MFNSSIRCYTDRRINCNYLRANAGLSGSFANSQRWVSDARKITYPRAFTNAIPTSWNHGKVGLKWININIKLSAALVIITLLRCYQLFLIIMIHTFAGSNIALSMLAGRERWGTMQWLRTRIQYSWRRAKRSNTLQKTWHLKHTEPGTLKP